YLTAVGNDIGTMLDNLDLAERLQLLPSADDWLARRQSRNQMVHEYIEAPNILLDALLQGHTIVPVLLQTATAFANALNARGCLQFKAQSMRAAGSTPPCTMTGNPRLRLVRLAPPPRNPPQALMIGSRGIKSMLPISRIRQSRNA